MLHHANGECGNCHLNYDGEGEDAHDREPLILVDNTHVTMGLFAEQHSCKSNDEPPHEWECYCETMTFSRSSCDGCGSTLDGERHAMTLWFD